MSQSRSLNKRMLLQAGFILSILLVVANIFISGYIGFKLFRTDQAANPENNPQLAKMQQAIDLISKTLEN